jgi:hypothetical protein
MYERDTSQEPLKASSPKLDFLEQSILNGFRWREAWTLADDQHKTAAEPLRTRLVNLLYLVITRLSGV